MYDLTKGCMFVDPTDCEANDWVQAFKAKTDPRTFDKVCRTLDAAIESEYQDSQMKCRITWTKTGAAVGHYSGQPLRDVKHAWDAVEAVMGNVGRPPIFTMGAMFKWRVSLRQEKHWLMKKEETGAIDPLDGTPIVAAEYFISDTFVPPMPKAPKKAKPVQEEPEVPMSAMAAALEAAFKKGQNGKRQ